MQCFGSENTEIIFSDKSFVNSTCPILLYSYWIWNTEDITQDIFFTQLFPFSENGPTIQPLGPGGGVRGRIFSHDILFNLENNLSAC